MVARSAAQNCPNRLDSPLFAHPCQGCAGGIITYFIEYNIYRYMSYVYIYVCVCVAFPPPALQGSSALDPDSLMLKL